MKNPCVFSKKTGSSFLVVMILLLGAIQLRAQNWEEVSQLPFPILLTSAETVDDEIYLFGGFRLEATTAVYAFNPATKSWRAPHWMPEALGATATAVLNGKVYLFGGAQGSSGTVTKKCRVYDPETDAWTALKDMSIARGYATAEVVNGKIYIIGGFGHGAASRFNLVEEYDPELDKFVTKTPMPTPRGYLTSTVMNGKIYVIGGGIPLTFEPLGAVEVYDPTTDSWLIGDDLPTPRWGMAAGTLNNRIYVVGGTFNAPGNPDTTLVEVYTEEVGWKTGEPLTFRMHGMSMAVFENKLYTFGGVIDYTTVVDDVLVFDPAKAGNHLSSNTIRMGTASLGSKIYFAGGSRDRYLIPSTVVDIYDVNSELWTTSNLSLARDFPVGVSNGSKVFFAGGIDFNNGVALATVDIYDTLTMQWTTAQLSEPRFGIAAVSYGNEVLFAGGLDPGTHMSYATVDIYNTETESWTTATLSRRPSGFMAYAVAGSKAIFAGGYGYDAFWGDGVSNAVDIYDFNTGIWTTDTLPLARGFLSATAVGNKVIIAGGMTVSAGSVIPTDRVDIYDVTTGIWTTSNISEPRAFFNYSASACGKAYFAGGGNFDLSTQSWTSFTDVVDIYDEATNTWSIDYLSHTSVNHGVVANGNQVFVAGGTDILASFDNVDIFTCATVGIEAVTPKSISFLVYPNPANDYLTIAFESSMKKVIVTITDITGKVFCTTTGSEVQSIDVSTTDFAEGVYIVQIQSENSIETQMVVVGRE